MTAACRRSEYQLLRIESVAWSARRIPTVVISVSRPARRNIKYEILYLQYSNAIWTSDICLLKAPSKTHVSFKDDSRVVMKMKRLRTGTQQAYSALLRQYVI
jgi:hypothetical protein